jgi:peptidoglycan/LPS O-acetylase OafA/YrhL
MKLHPDAGRRDDILAYKPFVDGLRAVSILAVVTHHAGLPGVSGGFVGVDVFFVISGYLIINQIVAGLASGRFSFTAFWARRVLRILPPYLLVISASLAVAPFILVGPKEFAELGKEALNSALMIVNHTFYAQKGYFDAAAETKPLLHLWSLAVEEQFYIAAPLLIFALWVVGRDRRIVWTVAVAAVFAVSFVICVLGTTRFNNPAFYLTPFRAWEFILGGLVPLSVPVIARAGYSVANALGWIGLLMITAAVFGLGRGTPYPWFLAAIPVLGACLVIAAGLANPAIDIVRLLSGRAIVWIGLVSYAWYLWHWPLLTFARIHNFGESIPVWDWSMVALSLLLAAATHHYLEVPIRRWRQRMGAAVLRWPTISAGVGSAAAVALAGFFVQTSVAAAVNGGGIGNWPKIATVDESCSLTGTKGLSPDCPAGMGALPVGVLIGNSHARMLFTQVHADAVEAGTALVSMIRTGCQPLYEVETVKEVGPKQKCKNWIATGLDLMGSELPRPPEYAIIASRWNNADYYDRDGAATRADFDSAGLTWPPPKGVSPVMAAGVGALIERLETAGVRRILVLGPTPEVIRKAPECVARARSMGAPADVCGVSRAQIERRRRSSTATLKLVAAQHPNVRYVDLIDLFCDADRCFATGPEGVLYVDNHHLSQAGARRVLDGLRGDFAWAFRGGQQEVAAPAAVALPR